MREQQRYAFFLVACALQCLSIVCVGSNQPQNYPNHNEFVPSRMIEEISNKCNICAYSGSTVRNGVIPSVTKAGTRFWSNSANDMEIGRIEDSKMTCKKWNEYSTTNSEFLAEDSAACLDLRDWLSWQCCKGIPSLYECETTVEETLLSPDNTNYKRSRVPIANGNVLDVSISVYVTEINIANHGVDGGAVEVTGTIQLKWIDERLKWNSSETGCSSISLQGSDVWVPQLVHDDNDTDDGTTELFEMLKVNVLADGRILWNGRLRMLASCKFAMGLVSRVCSINFLDREDIGRVRYIAKTISYDDDVSIPEYTLDGNQTIVLMDNTLTPYGEVQNVRLQFFFRPSLEQCDICGRNGKLFDGKIRRYGDAVKRLVPGIENMNCFEIDNLLTNVSVHSRTCTLGRANFEEPCCLDNLSSFDCESNIHDNIVDQYNTITPPDPSANEKFKLKESKDRVDVDVSLDVIQVIEIEVKSNTLKMLVNLELSWFDQRLAWNPFIGGCHRVTYRASYDAELTEIWVPNIELANMIEGVQEMPEAHASVYHSGLVVWRRTGTLEGTCELSGITSFPFDTISCYLDFGEERDPQFHRVAYRNLEGPQFFSSLRDDSWNYQEYKLIPERTEVENKEENLSGFKNKLIRYRFYFDRASHFYVHMFVVTYMLFTYLSFGTFFIDLVAGERLAYGTSILFVIVAQDITMTDSTPVTQEFLWIYQLSLGSKCFVIYGIVESLILQWILSKPFNNSKQNESTQEGGNAVTRENMLENVDTRERMLENDDSVVNNLRHGEERESASIRNKSADGSARGKHLIANISIPNLSFRRALRKGAKIYYSFGNKFAGLRVDESDSKRTKMEKRIKMSDVASFVICFTAYSVFVAILGATA